MTVTLSLEHEVSKRGHRASIPKTGGRRGPNRLLQQRIPCAQLARAYAFGNIAEEIIDTEISCPGFECPILFINALVAEMARQRKRGDVHQPGLTVERLRCPVVCSSRCRQYIDLTRRETSPLTLDGPAGL